MKPRSRRGSRKANLLGDRRAVPSLPASPQRRWQALVHVVQGPHMPERHHPAKRAQHRLPAPAPTRAAAGDDTHALQGAADYGDQQRQAEDANGETSHGAHGMRIRPAVGPARSGREGGRVTDRTLRAVGLEHGYPEVRPSYNPGQGAGTVPSVTGGFGRFGHGPRDGDPLEPDLAGGSHPRGHLGRQSTGSHGRVLGAKLACRVGVDRPH